MRCGRGSKNQARISPRVHDSDDECAFTQTLSVASAHSNPDSTVRVNPFLLRVSQLSPSTSSQISRDVARQRLSSLVVHRQSQTQSLITTLDVQDEILLMGSASGSVSFLKLSSDEFAISNVGTMSTMVTHALFHPTDRSCCATAGTSNQVCLWDLASCSVSSSFRSDSRVLSLDWNRNGDVLPALAVANNTTHVPIYDCRLGDTGRFVVMPWKATAVCWIPTDSCWLLAVGGDTGFIGLWDVRSARKQLATLSGSRGPYKSAHACPVGGMKAVDGHVISYSSDRRLYVFDSTSMRRETCVRTWGTMCRVIPGDPTTPFAATATSGQVTLGLPSDSEVHIVNLATTKKNLQATCLSGHVQPVKACAFRSQTQEFFTSGADKLLIFWKPAVDQEDFDRDERQQRQAAHEDQWSDSD